MREFQFPLMSTLGTLTFVIEEACHASQHKTLVAAMATVHAYHQFIVQLQRDVSAQSLPGRFQQLRQCHIGRACFR